MARIPVTLLAMEMRPAAAVGEALVKAGSRGEDVKEGAQAACCC